MLAMGRIRHTRTGTRKASFGAYRCPRHEVLSAIIPSLASQGASPCRIFPGSECDSATQLCVISKTCRKSCLNSASVSVRQELQPGLTILEVTTLGQDLKIPFFAIANPYSSLQYSLKQQLKPMSCPANMYISKPHSYSYSLNLWNATALTFGTDAGPLNAIASEVLHRRHLLHSKKNSSVIIIPQAALL